MQGPPSGAKRQDREGGTCEEWGDPGNTQPGRHCWCPVTSLQEHRRCKEAVWRYIQDRDRASWPTHRLAGPNHRIRKWGFRTAGAHSPVACRPPDVTHVLCCWAAVVNIRQGPSHPPLPPGLSRPTPCLMLPSLMVWKQHKDILSCSRLRPCEDRAHDRPSLGSHEIIQVFNIKGDLLFSSNHLKNGGPQVKA